MTTTRHVKAVRHPHLAAGADTALALIAIVLTPAIEWFDDHVAAPFAKWRKDRTGWEQTAAAIRASIVLGCVIGAIISLTGCTPGDDTVILAPGLVASVEYVDADLGLTTAEMAQRLDVNPEALSAALSKAVR